MEECLELEPRTELIGQGRRFVAGVLEGWELAEFVADAVLVASELLSNAVLHARTDLRLTVFADVPGTVRIEVLDHNSRMPTAVACPDDATSGRGLALVGAVATRWGSESRPDGKVVWAELGQRSDPPDPDCVDLRDSANVEEALGGVARSSGSQALGASG